jgi:LPXTG-motif cell wall-anchored protein
VRVFKPVAGTALVVAATVLLAPAVSANNAPGDNGTIKIHDATTGEELVRNEPHVCTFYLDAFGFDGLQQADWKIFGHAPTGTDLAKSGAITLDATGHGRTADLSLPDGHYKLDWNFAGEHGSAKQKVFWVTCTDSGGPGGGTGTPSGSPSPSDSATSAGSSGGSSSGGSQPSGSASPTSSSSSAAVSDTESPASSGGSLASTGTSVIGITAVAALLLAAGAAVRFRRRADRRH